MSDLKTRVKVLLHEIEFVHLKDKWVQKMIEAGMDERSASKLAAETGHIVDEFERTLRNLIDTFENSTPENLLQRIEDWQALQDFANQFSFTFGTGPDHSLFDVYVAGTFWQSFDGYAATSGERTKTVTLATTDQVSIEFRNHREKNALSTGYKLRFKEVVTTFDVNRRTVQYAYDGV
jgi:hypothetical protein